MEKHSSYLGAKALISLENLKNNLLVAKQIAPVSRQLLVVKGELYGHQVDAVLTTFNNALGSQDVMGVTDIKSALEIRNKLPLRRVVLLHGVFSEEEALLCCHNKIEMMLHHPAQLDCLLSIKKRSASLLTHIWFKLDSGMGRLGFNEAQIQQHLSQITTLKPHCLFSHFACADTPSHSLNIQQQKAFNHCQQQLNLPFTSCTNSAAILNGLSSFSKNEYIRPGIMLYGISPNPREQYHSKDLQLKPSMSFFAPIISIKPIKKGTTVGYGATWKAPQDSTIAILKAGYADGYPRQLSNQATVHLNGRFFNVIGIVSMDLIAIHIDEPKKASKPTIKVGDMAELWGEHVPLHDLAKKALTVPYELLVSVADRVIREIKEK